MIYYLNDEWEEGHGGELRLWPLPEEEAAAVVVAPRADRLVLFISSLEHEVLPAWRPRYALTTWMFNSRDTALPHTISVHSRTHRVLYVPVPPIPPCSRAVRS